MSAHCYLIALGSNQRHVRYGSPAAIVRTVPEALETQDIAVHAIAPVYISTPVGPSQRVYANTVLLAGTDFPPPQMLALLQQTERDFGRIRRGQRWRSRTLDLDIILWSGGRFTCTDLTIPHPHFRERGFVLDPAADIAPQWRDPVSGLRIRNLQARLKKRVGKA